MGKFQQYTSEKPMDTLEIRIYTGAAGRFDLYNDEGNNYNYEKGKYTIIRFSWNEQQQVLTIGKRQGGFIGAVKKCIMNIVWVDESNGQGIQMSPKSKPVIYTGEQITVSRK